MKVDHHTNGRFCFGKGWLEIYFYILKNTELSTCTWS